MKKAFTLMELVIVIAVIALVIAATFSLYTRVTAKQRDVQRVKDIENIYTALNLYALDNKYAMPDSNTALNVWRCLGSSATCWNGAYTNDSTLNSQIQTYLPNIPDDPKNNTGCQGDAYLYSSYANPGSMGNGTYLHWYSETGTTGCGPGVNLGSNSCGTYCYLKVSDKIY